jgi:hypothetical protein
MPRYLEQRHDYNSHLWRALKAAGLSYLWNSWVVPYLEDRGIDPYAPLKPQLYAGILRGIANQIGIGYNDLKQLLSESRQQRQREADRIIRESDFPELPSSSSTSDVHQTLSEPLSSSSSSYPAGKRNLFTTTTNFERMHKASRGRSGNRVYAKRSSPFTTAEKSGVVLKTEFGNAVSDNQCVYLGHSTHPSYIFHDMFLRTLNKMILNKLGCQFSDWNSQFNSLDNYGWFSCPGYSFTSAGNYPDSGSFKFGDEANPVVPILRFQLNVEYQLRDGNTQNVDLRCIIILAGHSLDMPVATTTNINKDVYAWQYSKGGSFDFYTECKGQLTPEHGGNTQMPVIPVRVVTPNMTIEKFHEAMKDLLWEGQVFSQGSNRYPVPFPNIDLTKPPRLINMTITNTQCFTVSPEDFDTTRQYVVHNRESQASKSRMIDMSSTKVRYNAISTLRIQNTTIANMSPTDHDNDLANNVENNPLTGIYYKSSKDRNFVQLGRPDLPSTLPYTRMTTGYQDDGNARWLSPIIYTAHPFTGTLSWGAKDFTPKDLFTKIDNKVLSIPSYETNFYNKPPPARYLGMTKSSKLMLDPGEIKFSQLKDSATISINMYLHKYWYAHASIDQYPNPNESVSKTTNILRMYIGKTALFAFEKYLDTRQTSPSAPRLGYQINYNFNAIAITKRKKLAVNHIVYTQPNPVPQSVFSLDPYSNVNAQDQDNDPDETGNDTSSSPSPSSLPPTLPITNML